MNGLERYSSQCRLVRIPIDLVMKWWASWWTQFKLKCTSRRLTYRQGSLIFFEHISHFELRLWNKNARGVYTADYHDEKKVRSDGVRTCSSCCCGCCFSWQKRNANKINWIKERTRRVSSCWLTRQGQFCLGVSQSCWSDTKLVSHVVNDDDCNVQFNKRERITKC